MRAPTFAAALTLATGALLGSAGTATADDHGPASFIAGYTPTAVIDWYLSGEDRSEGTTFSESDGDGDEPCDSE
ncbi:hypothetical protein ACIF8W_28710 [Streptomyces sp. NPDC085639]|uniref:hypothetical protein n=1 Tax=Streptomyces sp. NPDC085639 TaxID=3365734 RepID=UPI0037D7CF2B